MKTAEKNKLTPLELDSAARIWRELEKFDRVSQFNVISLLENYSESEYEKNRHRKVSYPYAMPS